MANPQFREIESSKLKESVLRAINKLAVPLAEVAIRSGVMIADVLHIIERASITVAIKRLKFSEKTSLTRVSLLTGIPRKKIRKYVHNIHGGDDASIASKVDGISMLLSIWHSDELYLNDKGLPRPLTKHGPGPCLRDLVDVLGRQLTVGVVVDEMMNSNSIVCEGGFYLPTSRAYLPAKASPEQMEIFGTASQGLLRTMLHNMYLRNDGEDRKLQKTTFSEIPESKIEMCEKVIRERMGDCLEEIDAFLLQVSKENAPDDKQVRFGVSCFEIYIDDHDTSASGNLPKFPND